MAIVSAHARIVCANGLMKQAQFIKPNDVVMDVCGRPQRVIKCKRVNLDVNDNICKIAASTFPEALAVPLFTRVMMDKKTWIPISDISSQIPDVPLDTDWISTDRWALSDGIHIIPNDHTIITKLVPSSFELGFVIGAFIASGSVSTPGTEVTFKFDATMGYRTLLDTCIAKIDPTAKLTMIKYREFKTLRVQSIILEGILSPLYHRNLGAIFDEWVCKDRDYIDGMYSGLSELAMTHRVNMDVYNLIFWCKHYLDPASFTSRLTRSQIVENNEDHEFVEITTPSAGIITNHMCIC
jgi:hypothetical protein